jgi:hypothetical protein
MLNKIKIEISSVGVEGNPTIISRIELKIFRNFPATPTSYEWEMNSYLNYEALDK